jgi:hypothetical protein
MVIVIKTLDCFQFAQKNMISVFKVGEKSAYLENKLVRKKIIGKGDLLTMSLFAIFFTNFNI